MSFEMILIPPELPLGSSYTLTQAMPVLRLESRAGESFGISKLDPIVPLPAGSQVELCGAGCNARTVKIRHRDTYYFVLQRDLAEAAASITLNQRVAERTTWQEQWLDRYAHAVSFYQRIVLQLKEAGEAGDDRAFEDLLRMAQAVKEVLQRCRIGDQNYCRE